MIREVDHKTPSPEAAPVIRLLSEWEGEPEYARVLREVRLWIDTELARHYAGRPVLRGSGKTLPLPLAEFRQRIERGEGCDLFDVGKPCECMFDVEEADHES